MTKIDIFSGFLGAGKTTLIKKLIAESYKNEKVVLIENEFGEIGIDGSFLKDAGVVTKEINSGCICCSLTGDFRAALKLVKEQFDPDRIIIEPSGVGKLSDIAAAVIDAAVPDMVLNGLTTVVDAGKCKMYMKNFGEFFNNQVELANCVVLSRTGTASPDKVRAAVELISEKNPSAIIVTAPWDELSGDQIMAAINKVDVMNRELEKLAEHAHDDDDDDECDDPECECHHHHGDDHDGEHHHHHHDGDDDECDDPECECHHHHGNDHDGEHHHHHHHHHDADEVFTSLGIKTARSYSRCELEKILSSLNNSESFGTILRAKGIVPCSDGGWFHFDYTPGETDIREGGAEVTGMICVIGSHIKDNEIKALFEVK